MALPPTPPPPMSTSSLSPSAKRIPLRIPPVKPPVLASDILREEVAPQAPGQKAVRVSLLALSAIGLAMALASAVGVGATRLAAPQGLEISLGTAFAAAVLAVI